MQHEIPVFEGASFTAIVGLGDGPSEEDKSLLQKSARARGFPLGCATQGLTGKELDIDRGRTFAGLEGVECSWYVFSEECVPTR